MERPRAGREIAERYRLERILKSGPTATVLRAVDTSSGRAVAVKLLNPGSDPAGLDRFDALAAALGAIDQPVLPGVFDWGFTSDGFAFLVSELVDGRSFAGLAGTSHRRIASLAAQGLGGIEALGARGFAHGNLSPDNLLVEVLPSGQRLRLVGLGTACFRRPGTRDVSPAARFRSPEEIAGGQPTLRGDLYSLARSLAEVLGAEVADPDGPSPRLSLPFSFEIERAELLRSVLESCLRRNPEDRPNSADEVRRGLRNALGKGFEPEPPWVPQARPAAPLPPPLSAPDPPAATADMEALLDKTQPVEPRPWQEPEMTAGSAPEPVVPEAPAASGSILPEIDFAALGSQEPEPDRKAAPIEAPPAVAAAPPPGPAATGAPFSRGASVAERPGLPWRRIVGVGAVAAVVAAGIAAWLFRSPPPVAPAPQPPPRAAAPEPPPKEPPEVRLEAAKRALAEGDYGRAQQLFASLDAADQARLSPEACRQLQVLGQTIPRIAAEQLPADLARALGAGNVEQLRLLLAAVPDPHALPANATLPREFPANLDRAEQVVRLFGEAEQAAAAGQPARALERFAVLAALLPPSSPAFALRERAAEAIEKEADDHASRGEYPQAAADLSPLLSQWPARPGLKEKIAAYQRFQRLEADQQALLANVPRYLSRRRPDEGLDQLRAIKPTPHLAAPFAEAQKQLTDQLAQIDAKPPAIEISGGYDTQFFRGTVANVGFRATDDYKVVSLEIFAVPRGGGQRRLKAEKVGLRYEVAIPPSLHGNQPFEVVAVATDLSGHQGRISVRLSPVGSSERMVR